MANTWITGGRGTMANAANDNGGGHTGSVAWADVMGANGGPLHTVVGADYDTATGVITKAGEFAVDLTGIFVHTKEGAAGAWAEDWHAITASDANTITIASGLGDNVDVDCWVGGAFDDNKSGIDAGLAVMAGGDVTVIATNPASQKNYDCATTITIPAALAGTAGAECIIKGVDYADGGDLAVSEQMPKLTGTVSLASGLLYFGNEANDYFIIENIEMDAGGAGKADFCVKGVTGTNYLTFKKCVLHNALDNAAFYSDGDYCRFFGCEIYNSGYGIRSGGGDMSYTVIHGCSIHDNTNDGVLLDHQYQVIKYSLFYDNGGRGLFLVGNSQVSGNLFFANDGHNIQWETCTNSIMTNNTMSGSTGGYGIQLDTEGFFLQFSNNNSYNNSSGHCNRAAADGAWDVYLDGNNNHDDPAFEGSDADGDFRPGDGSSLLGAGYPDYFPFEGDRDNLQNYGHIGAVTRDEPAGGGGILLANKRGNKQ